MKPSQTRILTSNGGSSSIKFALYQTDELLRRWLYGNDGKFQEKLAIFQRGDLGSSVC
jgi:hypothetical protein